MPVLGYAACQKYRKRNDPAGKKRYEDHMRSRLRYEPDCCGKKYHYGGILAYPAFKIDECHGRTYDGKYAESPQEDDRGMP